MDFKEIKAVNPKGDQLLIFIAKMDAKAPKSLQMVIAAMKLKDAFSPWKESYDKPRQCIKKQRHYFADKGLSSQSYCSSSHHVWMRDLNQKEG